MRKRRIKIFRLWCSHRKKSWIEINSFRNIPKIKWWVKNIHLANQHWYSADMFCVSAVEASTVFATFPKLNDEWKTFIWQINTDILLTCFVYPLWKQFFGSPRRSYPTLRVFSETQSMKSTTNFVQHNWGDNMKPQWQGIVTANCVGYNTSLQHFSTSLFSNTSY